MKKLAVAGLCFFGLLNQAGAQIKKGTMELGASLNVSRNSRNESYKNSLPGAPLPVITSGYFGVYPSFGFFIADNLSLGLSLGYNYNYYKNSSSSSAYQNGAADNSVVFKPFMRKYFVINEKMVLFMQGDVSYSSAWGKNYYGVVGNFTNEETSTNTYGCSIGFGAEYFITGKLAVEASLAVIGFQYFSGTISDTGANPVPDRMNDGNNLTGVFSGGNLSLGLKYYLHKD